ncbi:MAG: FABP family protein [Acidimicrobiales bacterium]
MTPSLHPDLDPIADLVGTWSGTGTGEYPTIDDFAYVEELTFGHVGKPFLSMVQRTRDPGTAAPMHAESGYLRLPAPATVELVVAQPSGLVEVGTGTVGPGHLVVRSVVHATPTAKEVTAVERELRWGDDVLTYDLRMAAVGQPMLHHLSAVLERTA